MSIPIGGAASAAGGAGAAKAASSAASSTAPAVGEAANAAGQDAGETIAKDAGYGSGGGVGSAAEAIQGAAGGGTGGTPDVAGLVKASTAPPQLGAGGTSMASNPEDQSGSPMGMDGGGGGLNGKNLAAGAAAVPVASGVAQLMFLMMILNWLKMMFMGALAAIANFINMIIGAVIAVVKGVVGGALAVGGAIASATGGAISAVAGAVTAGVTAATLVAVGVSVVVTGGTGLTAQRDGALYNCSAEVQSAVLVQDAPDEGANAAQTLKNAKTVYSVLSAWGMGDENIAGILGNWSAESGIDPTIVQGIFRPAFATSDEKKAGAADTNNGIGLGQWTFGRNTELRNYATSIGKDWWTVETQLGYMISKDAGVAHVKHMIATPLGSAAEATKYFHDKWEVSADTDISHRVTAAEKWFAQMGSWTKDQSLADSILAQSGSTVDSANTARVANAKASCLTDKTVVNASLKEGGLNLEEATAYMANYKTNGEAALVANFGGGGPGDCGYGKADNCVGFSSYFIMSTTDRKDYVGNNGVDFVGTAAGKLNLKVSSTPSVYSIFSTPVTAPYGHTGVVLGIDGDDLIIGEASCGSAHAGTRAYRQPISGTSQWSFVDITSIMTGEKP